MRLPRGGPARRGSRPGLRTVGPVSVTVAAVALLVASCHAPGGSGSGASGLPQLTVAATPGVSDAPLYLAAADGLFAKAGVQVTIRSADDKTALSDLESGTVDVAAADYADFFYAQGLNPSLRILADGYDGAPNTMEILSLPNSKISTPDDLVGMTIGTPEPQEFPYSSSLPYSLDTMAAQQILLDDGVSPTTVNWRAMPSQDLVGALKRGQVNAILVTEPYIFQAESQVGAVEVLDALTGQTASLPLAGYFTSAAIAGKDATALNDFRSALIEAQAEAASGRAVRAVLAHYPQMGGVETADMVTLGVYPTSLNINGVQQVVNLMYSFGMISTPITVSSILVQ
jgi:NitT/TauT family transport system substrate-binding protein